MASPIEITITPNESSSLSQIVLAQQLIRERFGLEAKVITSDETTPSGDGTLTLAGSELPHIDEVVDFYDGLILMLGLRGDLDKIVKSFTTRTKRLPIYHALLGLLRGGHEEKAKQLVVAAGKKGLSLDVLIANCNAATDPNIISSSWQILHEFLQKCK